MNAYKLEVRFTIMMSVLLLLAGNVALIFSIFPVNGMLFGFPIMYIIPILSGWFGILFLTIVASKIGNHIDEKIEQANEQGDPSLEQIEGFTKKKKNYEGA
ncbi:hypothetical protein CR194_19000 [Salipaludibacillus keqinensis]|uniref:Uncharacterized protein n=1 Tax=Salipaludibacillus keqinensis TaxID=2045207 RepID=A0A323TGM9_9BACI|nr:hypothetical protein [Salipaludibacillus keqinensis]PYZ91713.1 hypothetical protein CR194_19000 [Salipaludibacillus keqinensis]